MAAPLSPLFILPNENTNAGAMARLFINEAAGPDAKADLTVQAMGWMRCVLQNRLKYPGRFGAPGATSITEIITAHARAIQFAGFERPVFLAHGRGFGSWRQGDLLSVARW